MKKIIVLLAILINLAAANEAKTANLTTAKDAEPSQSAQISVPNLTSESSEQDAFLPQESRPNGMQIWTDAAPTEQSQPSAAAQSKTQILTADATAQENFKNDADENSASQKANLSEQISQNENAAQTAQISATDSNMAAAFEPQNGERILLAAAEQNSGQSLTQAKNAPIAANSASERNLAQNAANLPSNLAQDDAGPSDATEPSVQDEAKRLYEAAAKFEHEGEAAKALQLYKLAAKKAIFTDEHGEMAAMERSVIAPSDSVAGADVEERKIAAKEQPGPQKTGFESGEPYNVDEILGLKMHHLNYLLPATYALNRFDDRRRFETAFQISLQKPLFYDVFDLNETISAGYSQSSWWQTAKSSTPFRETNYRPEIFVTFPTRFEALPSLDYLRAGLLHESNGQGGEKSRSWNRIYLEAKLYAGSLVVIPRAWARIPEKSADDDNPDIEKYLGNMDVNFALPYRGHIFTAMVRNNLHFDKTNRGAGELGWLFPFGKSGVYGYVKYFTGYGESLIDYNRHTDKIGIGFAILK